MDATALSLCMENDLPIYVFNLDDARQHRPHRGGPAHRYARLVGRPRGRPARRRARRRAPVPRRGGGPARMIDDLMRDARSRMDKSIEATRHEFNTVRTGRASAALLDRIQVLVLRHQDAAEPAGLGERARAAPAVDHALRQGRDERHRARHPGVRPGSDAVERRPAHPPADPAADRGAAQGARQGRPPPRRGGARRRPQRAPRRHPPPQGRGEERRRLVRTTSIAPRSGCRS